MSQERMLQLAQTIQVMAGYKHAALVGTAAEIGLFEALRKGPKSASVLADELKAHPSELQRLLEAMHWTGLIASGEEYRLTEKGEAFMSQPVLQAQAMLTLRAMSEWLHLPKMVLRERRMPAYGDAEQTLAHERAKPVVDLLEKLDCIPADGVVSEWFAESWEVLKLLAGRFPKLGMNPRYPNADEEPEEPLLRERYRIVPKVDMHFMVGALSQRNDKRAQVLLECCASQLEEAEKIIVVEKRWKSKRKLPSLLDIDLLVSSGGRMREASELEQLLHKSGFRPLRKAFSEDETHLLIEAERT